MNERILTPDWQRPGIMTVRDLYRPDECSRLISIAEEKYGFVAASVRTRSGPQMRTDIRNNERVVFDDQDVADKLWHRIKEFLPEINDARASGVDPSLRFYKYSGSQRFRRHKDGVATNSNGELSRYSYLLYLNDNFEGGETVFSFFTHHEGARQQEKLPIRPETGMALLFLHDQWHEGVPVSSGAKYVLRTDVFYTNDKPVDDRTAHDRK